MSKYQHSKEEVILVPVPGSWISCQSVLPPPDADNENSIQVSNRLKPIKCNPENDTLCIIPVMPTLTPYVDESVLNKSKNQIEILAPLKSNKSPYSEKSVHGYRSGARSSLVPCRKIKSTDTISSSDWVIGTDDLNGVKYIADFEHGEVFVRIKGCGMWLLGRENKFPDITLEKSESRFAEKDQEVFDVRGVCYEHTSCTEMLATSAIENNLNKAGFFCGNHSLGFWIYRNLKDDNTPLLTKTVSLFETYSDRRLESHLFAGLEKLLSKKYDQSFAQKVIDTISPLYENMKNLFPSDDCNTFRKVGYNYIQSIQKKVEEGTFFNLDDFDMEEFTDDNLRKIGLIPTYEVYEQIKSLGKDFVDLAKLYGRLGFESGKYLSIIHRTGYIWGTFFDHSLFEIHCNAHTNNLIVLSKDQCLSNKKRIQILAPVDFDMSFKKENSVNYNVNPPIPYPEIVIRNFTDEFYNLIKDVSGFSACHQYTSAINTRPMPPGLLSSVLWFLRDCAAYEFYTGYQKIGLERCKGNDISVDDMYKFIYEALDETIDDNS